MIHDPRKSIRGSTEHYFNLHGNIFRYHHESRNEALKIGNHVIQKYKDGYTDISGKFDYASISTDQLNRTTKFAIFVEAEGLGCVVIKTSTITN